MKIGFIGCGNMATAIIKGIVESKFLDCKDIFVTDINREKMYSCSKEYNINISDNVEDLIKEVNVVVLSVKPKVFEILLPSIDKFLAKNNPLIISIAAGKSTEFIQSFLTYDANVIRVMPNINAKVCEAMCAYCCNKNVTKEQKEFTNKIFSSVGKIIELDEQYFPLFGVIAGCAPAFAYMFIDELARAAVKNGMDKKTALEVASQTVYGSAKMILDSNEHPWDLIDKVCSPGGTTIEGVLSLKESGFETAIDKAVDSAVEKDKLL